VEEISERGATARPTPLASSVYPAIKRTIDIVGAATLLVVLSPVFLIIAIVIGFDTGLPVIYRCQRLARNGHPIVILKFRTMRNGSHQHLEGLLSNDEELRMEYALRRKLRNDPRHTRVGATLRRTSLDELPQLWNVLTGQMSLVGPRPYFIHELDGRPERSEILGLRPGLTGLWQVNGRSDRTFEDRIALDLDYAARRGLWVDLQILIQTPGAVLTGRGAY
jgi:lipopolysaccharide/colanic/teichoic acid biosynthesis glycosyltransferase